jgi:MerR family transcriptional regulator/heat shock protein HspR
MQRRQTDQEEYEGVYIISVAARILEMHPQTLRKYERVGLVMPSRTVGMLRLYSEEDVARLRLIKHLVSDLGLNLAGVQMALGIFNKLVQMKSQMSTLKGDALKQSLNRSIDDMLELLHSKLR